MDHSEDVAEYEGQKDIITIKLSLLSEEIRGFRGTGGRKKLKTDTYTEIRESQLHEKVVRLLMAQFHIGLKKSWFDEIDRWWGCEIEFSPLLDRVFQVKNIKRGAVPIHELKQAIYELINPTVLNYQGEIRRIWDEKAEKKKEEERQRVNTILVIKKLKKLLRTKTLRIHLNLLSKKANKI